MIDDEPALTSVAGWRAFQSAYAQFVRDVRIWDDDRRRSRDAISTSTGDPQTETSQRPTGCSARAPEPTEERAARC
jgi:hypothetical protein